MQSLQEGKARDFGLKAVKACEKVLKDGAALEIKAQGKPYTEGILNDTAKLMKTLKGKKTKLQKLEDKSKHGLILQCIG